MTTMHNRREQALATGPTETRTPAPHRTGVTGPRTATGPHLTAVIRSESLRLRSLRSTAVLLGLAALFAVGLAAAAGPLVVSVVADGIPFDETGTVGPSLLGSQFMQVPIAVLGVLFITSDVRSGGLRTAYLAVPHRWPVLVAKTVVVGAAVFAFSLVALTAAMLVGAASISAAFEPVWHLLWSGSTFAAIVGGALFMTFVAWFGLGLGAVTRSTAGALGVVAVLMFVLPLFVQGLDHVPWLLDALPSTNQGLLMVPDGIGDVLRGVLIDLAWAGGLLLLGGAILQRRDA